MITNVPHVTFKTRVRNDALGGSNPFEWKDVTTNDLFENKKVVIFLYQVLSHQPAQHLIYHAMKNCTANSKHKA